MQTAFGRTQCSLLCIQPPPELRPYLSVDGEGEALTSELNKGGDGVAAHTVYDEQHSKLERRGEFESFFDLSQEERYVTLHDLDYDFLFLL